MAKRKQYNKNLYILLGASLVITALFLSGLQNEKSKSVDSKKIYSNNPSPSRNKYYSVALDVSLNIPLNFNVDKQFVNSIYFKNDKGVIEIHKLNTNLTNLEDYLKGYDAERTINVVKKEDLQINGYQAVARVEKFHGGPVDEEKAYFIYVPEGRIYTISTNAENLYPDLDQIARSFRYEP